MGQRNATISVTPLSGAIGAELHGVDLSANLSESTIDEIRAALREYLVVFFRDQRLTPAQHVVFGKRFGTLNIHPYIAGLEEQPEVMEFVKEPDERGYNVGGVWHSDMSFCEEPSMASILYAHETPPAGGDTLFSNAYLAYEMLSDGMKKMLEGLKAVHWPGRSYGAGGKFDTNKGKGQRKMRIATVEEDAEVLHPVVRTHPDTGRKVLYVNGNFTRRFEAMTEQESRPLLDYLTNQVTRPEFTCRFRWKPGSVAFWDNRCTQHLAINDYHGYRRRMHRVTLNGDRPY